MPTKDDKSPDITQQGLGSTKPSRGSSRVQGKLARTVPRGLNSSNAVRLPVSYAETLKQEGKQEGLREGIRKGEHDAQLKIAQHLLKSGVDSSIIASATHLSTSQIEEIRKTLH